MNLGLKQLVSEHSTVVAVKDQVSADLAGEAVILNLKSGVYYGLNAVGGRIWQLLQEPRTVAAIRDTLLEEYEVDRDSCDRDLLAVLQELATAELIEVNHEATA
ncbi:MAG TPA: lasso peptide biosynthesis PqqD family chaperone [Chroococcales cyanobacterium]|jgi:hypothetical protein